MANRNIRFPVGAMVDSTGFVTLEWSLWLQNPEFLTILTGIPLPVDSGGTGLTSGTSGGVLGFTGTETIASSVELTADQIVIGGGAGATPFPLGSYGTTSQVLFGNASGAPSFGAIPYDTDQGVLATDIFGRRQAASMPSDESSTDFSSDQNILANHVFGG